MYKLIIIDDEDTIRSGLADFIPWEDLGFTVAAEFEDGQDAIPYLKKNAVDVILTDIMMAEVSGLALAKHIYKEMPEVKVVLISGFKEFEYAQQAIQYNVNHYLLKPTRIEEIAEVFSQLKLELDKNKEQEAEKKQSQEWQLLLQEQFFTDLLMGALRNREDMQARMDKIGLPIKPSNSCCIIDIRIGPSSSTEPLTHSERDKVVRGLGKLFKNNEHEQVQFYPVYHPVQGLKVVAVFAERLTALEGTQLVSRILHRIRSSTQEIFGVDVLLEIGNAYVSFEKLAMSSEALRLVQHTPGGKLRLAHNEYDQIVTKYTLFISNMIEGNATEAASLLDRFLEEFRDIPVSFTHRLIKDLFAIIQHTFEQGGVDVQSLTGIILNEEMESRELEDIKKLSKQMLAEVINSTAAHKSQSSAALITKAQAYIWDNYSKDLSLESVANQIFLHPVYFSKLFKQYAKVNFTDYLTTIRIQKALELLSEQKYKMYEIGEMVGYTNSKYFYRVFKQVTGYTPKEYFRQHYGMRTDR